MGPIPADKLARMPKEKVGGLVQGFGQFISQYGVLPLAIGVVIGNAVNDLVKTLVDGLITPFISLFSPTTRLQDLQITFQDSVFKVGSVLNSLVTFVIVALVVYVTVGVLLKKQDLLQKK